MSSFSTYRYGALACTIAIINLINTVCANSIDFSSRTELQQWYGMTDRVMGGRSSTSFYAERNYAVFRGYLSLENNGGFALVSRSLLWVDTSDGDAIHLVSRGDGKRYQLRVGLSQYPGDVAYVADFNSQNVNGKPWLLNRVILSPCIVDANLIVLPLRISVRFSGSVS